eukprot:GEMP01026761.1.p1 GENE.GEMP01026761.1~~GEMP01026761.1.p1  ORF type:complete len:599 (+),score=166.14 GEMP01026761.1:74-1870(+)
MWRNGRMAKGSSLLYSNLAHLRRGGGIQSSPATAGTSQATSSRSGSVECGLSIQSARAAQSRPTLRPASRVGSTPGNRTPASGRLGEQQPKSAPATLNVSAKNYVLKPISRAVMKENGKNAKRALPGPRGPKGDTEDPTSPRGQLSPQAQTAPSRPSALKAGDNGAPDGSGAHSALDDFFASRAMGDMGDARTRLGPARGRRGSATQPGNAPATSSSSAAKESTTPWPKCPSDKGGHETGTRDCRSEAKNNSSEVAPSIAQPEAESRPTRCAADADAAFHRANSWRCAGGGAPKAVPFFASKNAPSLPELPPATIGAKKLTAKSKLLDLRKCAPSISKAVRSRPRTGPVTAPARGGMRRIPVPPKCMPAAVMPVKRRVLPREAASAAPQCKQEESAPVRNNPTTTTQGAVDVKARGGAPSTRRTLCGGTSGRVKRRKLSVAAVGERHRPLRSSVVERSRPAGAATASEPSGHRPTASAGGRTSDRTQKSGDDVRYNGDRLPIRPNQALCAQYAEEAVCDEGAICPYNHQLPTKLPRIRMQPAPKRRAPSETSSSSSSISFWAESLPSASPVSPSSMSSSSSSLHIKTASLSLTAEVAR